MARESSKAVRGQKEQFIFQIVCFVHFFMKLLSYQTLIRLVENQQGRSSQTVVTIMVPIWY